MILLRNTSILKFQISKKLKNLNAFFNDLKILNVKMLKKDVFYDESKKLSSKLVTT